MPQQLDPVQLRRLLARTLATALAGGPASAQLLDRWAHAEAPDASWLAALTWDGIGAALGWALEALELRDVVPPEVDEAAATAHEEARAQAVALLADLAALGTALEAERVPAVALKGSALLVGNVAPALGARWMSDLDVLVPEASLEQAGGVAESLGYAAALRAPADPPAGFRPYHVSYTNASGRILELHWKLGPARWGAAAEASGWLARARPSGVAGVLSPAAADLFWHQLLHDARNHAWSSGSLRAAFDLALIARAPGFTMGDIQRRLDEDPAPAPLLDAVADAAWLSPILAAEVEPAVEPRYLRLARWRDWLGRRNWETHRISEAIAWGATFDRVRRFGGWRGAADRALRVVPEAAAGIGFWGALRRGVLNARHAGFVLGLGTAHLFAIPESRRVPPRALPSPAPLDRG